MSNVLQTYSVRSDKGFFVGDLTCAIDEKLYDDVWGELYAFEDGLITDPKTNFSFAVANTAKEYDSAVYWDTSCENKYRVYSNCISIVPLELVVEKYSYCDENGKVFYGGGECLFTTDFNGFFRIVFPDGTITEIDTRYEEWYTVLAD